MFRPELPKTESSSFNKLPQLRHCWGSPHYDPPPALAAVLPACRQTGLRQTAPAKGRKKVNKQFLRWSGDQTTANVISPHSGL